MSTWIQTFSGKAFHYPPAADQIDAETIATALSRTCRFSGHCKWFYSVAQHSVHVSLLVPSRLALPALLHDAHEVYTGFGDVPSPVKRLMPPEVREWYKSHELTIDEAIASHFGFDPGDFHKPGLMHADMIALATEKRDLMAEPPEPWIELPPPSPLVIVPKSIEESKALFLERLHWLAAK